MKGSPFFFGRWGVRPDELTHASGSRWHIVNDEHAGPVVQFPTGGVVEPGTPVIVYIHADLCLRRGWGNFRHRTRLVLRVKPLQDGEAGLRNDQGTLRIVQYDPQVDKAYRIAGDWWLYDDSGEPREKYEPPPFTEEELDLCAVRLPAPPEWR